MNRKLQPTKADWLQAVKQKIADYKKDWKNYGTAATCSFCQLNGYNCNLCIFTHAKYGVGCLHMHTFPNGRHAHTLNRIEFLEKAHDILAALPEERFDFYHTLTRTYFPELWELDKSMPRNFKNK